MRLKIYLFLLFSIFFSRVNSQIAITEIYYNTPYNESLKYTTLNPNPDPNITIRTAEHHRGEFIELYNYSDTDINLSGWYLRDYVGTYWLPNRVLKSGEFLVVAYGKVPNEDYFPTFFNTTQGKESQIIYQNVILLRNKNEKVILGCEAFKGQMPITSNSFEWSFGSNPSTNFIYNSWENSSNFYSVESVHYGNYETTPDPLAESNKPAMQSLYDIMYPIYQNNYSYLDWSENVTKILENTCPISIDVVSQTPSGIFNDGIKCFSYDDAGAQISTSDCNSNNSNPTITNEYSYDELENIKNSIVIYPNPTRFENQYNVTISWSGVSLNKISNLKVFTSNAGLVYGFSPINSVNSTSFSLSGQLSGTFVVNFTLNTGQVISKNILKW